MNIENVAICICDTFANNNIVTGGNASQRKRKTGADSVRLTMQNIENILLQNPEFKPPQIHIGCTGKMVPEVDLILDQFPGIHIYNDPHNYGMQKGSAVGYQLAIGGALDVIPVDRVNYIICHHGDIFVDTPNWISKLAEHRSTILLPKWYNTKGLYVSNALDTKFFAGSRGVMNRVRRMSVPPLQIGDPSLRQNDIEHNLAKAISIPYTITHQELTDLGIDIYHSHYIDWKQHREPIIDCP